MTLLRLITLMAVVQLGVAIFLCVIVAWQWFDVRLDWIAAQKSDNDAVYQQGLGVMRLAWIRVFYSLLLLAIAVGTVLIDFERYGDQIDVFGRTALFVLTLAELAKVSTERLTRHSVDEALHQKESRR